MTHNILVVDDSGYSRATIKTILTESGYNVIGEARNGAEALDLIVQLKPDLITLDNILPDMSGIEVLKALREQGVQCKVIMISAVGQQSAIEEGLDLGANAYIIKPFTKEKVLEEVKISLGT